MPDTAIENTPQSLPFLHQVRGMLFGLAVEFLLGMVVNLWDVPPGEETAEHMAPLFSRIAFGLHGLMGFALVVGAITLVVRMRNMTNMALKKWAWMGSASIVMAAAGGLGVVKLEGDLSEAASLVMAAGFLLAFTSYSRLWYLGQRTS